MESLQRITLDDIIRPTRPDKTSGICGGTDMEIGVYEAKSRLSELIRILESEKEIIITNTGKPVAKLVPFVPEQRPFGLMKGKYVIPDDIDECNEEIAEMFGVK